MNDFQGSLEKYFLQALVPDSIAKPVLRSLTQFAAKASQVGSAGLLLLVVTALAMMLTIDRTLNGIWGPAAASTAASCSSVARSPPSSTRRSRPRHDSCGCKPAGSAPSTGPTQLRVQSRQGQP